MKGRQERGHVRAGPAGAVTMALRYYGDTTVIAYFMHPLSELGVLSPHGVRRQIAEGGGEVRLVHRDGAEPSLSEVAGAPSPCVDHARVTSARRTPSALGRENEMGRDWA